MPASAERSPRLARWLLVCACALLAATAAAAESISLKPVRLSEHVWYWGRYREMPAFDAANRVNAYGTYLLMERESLQKK